MNVLIRIWREQKRRVTDISACVDYMLISHAVQCGQLIYSVSCEEYAAVKLVNGEIITVVIIKIIVQLYYLWTEFIIHTNKFFLLTLCIDILQGLVAVRYHSHTMNYIGNGVSALVVKSAYKCAESLCAVLSVHSVTEQFCQSFTFTGMKIQFSEIWLPFEKIHLTADRICRILCIKQRLCIFARLWGLVEACGYAVGKWFNISRNAIVICR